MSWLFGPGDANACGNPFEGCLEALCRCTGWCDPKDKVAKKDERTPLRADEAAAGAAAVSRMMDQMAADVGQGSAVDAPKPQAMG